MNWRARARARACVCVGMRCDNLIVAPPPAVPAICPRFAGVQWCEALVAVISQRGECVDIGLHAAAVDAAATMVRYFSESKKVRHMGVCASMHACVCACVCVRLEKSARVCNAGSVKSSDCVAQHRCHWLHLPLHFHTAVLFLTHTHTHTLSLSFSVSLSLSVSVCPPSPSLFLTCTQLSKAIYALLGPVWTLLSEQLPVYIRTCVDESGDSDALEDSDEGAVEANVEAGCVGEHAHLFFHFVHSHILSISVCLLFSSLLPSFLSCFFSFESSDCGR